MKFAMSLVWHNSVSCPPTENENRSLYMTDGKNVIEVEWRNGTFWFTEDRDVPVEYDEHWWWADIRQTISKSPDFQ